DVDLPFVSFRHTYRFPDGPTLASDSTLRFREHAEIAASLHSAGFDVADVRHAPDRPGSEYVFPTPSTPRTYTPPARPMVALNATMGPSGARRKASAEALLQRRELVLQRGRDLVLADGGEPLFDERDLLPPLVDVDVERGLDVLDRLGQAGRLDVVGR